MNTTRRRRGVSSRGARTPSAHRIRWIWLASPFALLALIIWVNREHRLDAEAEDYLVQKDRLIQQFRGFERRAAALAAERAAHFEELYSQFGLEERQRIQREALEEFGEEKMERMLRRLDEMRNVIVPKPEQDADATDRKLRLLRASERQWLALADELTAIREARVSAASAALDAKRHAEAVALQVQQAVEQQALKRKVRAESPWAGQGTASSVQPDEPLRRQERRDEDQPSETPARERPLDEASTPELSRQELRALALKGECSKEQWSALAVYVFGETVPSWAEGVYDARAETPLAEHHVAGLLAALRESPSAGPLLPWVEAAVRSGVRHTELLWYALDLRAAAGEHAQAAQCAQYIAQQIRSDDEPDEAEVLRRIPGGAAIKRAVDRKDWLASAMEQMASDLPAQRVQPDEWLARYRARELRSQFGLAVRESDQEDQKAAIRGMMALDPKDPVPHLLEALVGGSLSSAVPSESALRRRMTKFRRLCDAINAPHEPSSRLPLEVAERLREFGIDGLCGALGVAFADLSVAIKIDATYAFPLAPNLEKRMRRIRGDMAREDRRVRGAEQKIRNYQSQRRRVSPNDRLYIDRLIRDQRALIEKAKASRKQRQADVAEMERVLARVKAYAVRPPRY